MTHFLIDIFFFVVESVDVHEMVSEDAEKENSVSAVLVHAIFDFELDRPGRYIFFRLAASASHLCLANRCLFRWHRISLILQLTFLREDSA